MDKFSVEWEAMRRAHWNRSTSSSNVKSANSQLKDSRHANESRIYHGHSGCAQLFYGFIVLAPLGFVAIKKIMLCIPCAGAYILQPTYPLLYYWNKHTQFGFSPADWKRDWIQTFINTCTITNYSHTKSSRWLCFPFLLCLRIRNALLASYSIEIVLGNLPIHPPTQFTCYIDH